MAILMELSISEMHHVTKESKFNIISVMYNIISLFDQTFCLLPTKPSGKWNIFPVQFIGEGLL